MDMYQIRALELEIEQLDRFNHSEKKNTFFQDEFEVGQAAQIARLRRISRTYSVNYW